MRNKRLGVYVFLLFAFFVSFMSVGYAYYQVELEITGNITVEEKNFYLKSVQKLKEEESLSFTKEMKGEQLLFYTQYSLELKDEETVEIQYVFTNPTNEPYYLLSFSSVGEKEVAMPCVVNLNYDEAIMPHETREVLLTYFVDEGEFVSTEVKNEFVFGKEISMNSSGEILASLHKKEEKMNDDRLIEIDYSVINSQFFSVMAHLKIENEQLEVNDNKKIYIKPGEESIEKVSVRIPEQMEFPVSIPLSLVLEDGTRVVIGKVTVFE